MFRLLPLPLRRRRRQRRQTKLAAAAAQTVPPSIQCRRRVDNCWRRQIAMTVVNSRARVKAAAAADQATAAAAIKRMDRHQTRRQQVKVHRRQLNTSNQVIAATIINRTAQALTTLTTNLHRMAHQHRRRHHPSHHQGKLEKKSSYWNSNRIFFDPYNVKS